MLTLARRVFRASLPLTAFASLALVAAPAANAAVTTYIVSLSGPNESPPNASPGTGLGTVDIDPVAHTMRVQVTFSGLTGNTTACHIHAPTTVALTGTASVATTTPTFAGFPGGVTFGSYDNTLDMTQSTSYNAPFLAANGGSTAAAETALFQHIADGKAYLNIHSSTFGGGEIRGFLTPGATPVNASTWGRIKFIYR
jgi:hypothetical protein